MCHDGADDGAVLLVGERGGVGVQRQTRRALRQLGCAGPDVEVKAVVGELGVADRDAQGKAVRVEDREVVQRQPVQHGVGHGAPRRRWGEPRTGLGAVGCGVRQGGGGARRRIPGARCLVHGPRPPPADVQGRDLDPDAGVVPRQSPQRDPRLPLHGARELLHAGPDIAVGVGLQVGIAHRRQALDEHDRWVTEARADGVGEQEAHPRVAPGALGFGRVRQAGGDVERLPVGPDVGRRGDGDGGPGPREAGVLGGDRPFEDAEDLVGPSGRITAQRGGGGVPRFHIGDLTWAWARHPGRGVAPGTP